MARYDSSRDKFTLRKLDPNYLLRQSNRSIVGQGQLCHSQGMGQVVEADDDSADVIVQDPVHGSCKVHIWLDSYYGNTTVEAECDCGEALSPYKDVCKHKVCALLTLADYYIEQGKPTWNNQLDQMLVESESTPKNKPKYLLVFEITRIYRTSIHPRLLPLENFGKSLPSDRSEIIKAITERKLYKQLKEMSGTQLFNRLYQPKPAELAAARILLETWRYYDISMDSILPLISDSIVLTGTTFSETPQIVEVCKGNADVEINMQKTEKGISIVACAVIDQERMIPDKKNAGILCENPMWMQIDSKLFRVIENTNLLVSQMKSGSIDIPEKDTGEFLHSYLPIISEKTNVTGDSLANTEELNVDFVPRVYISESEGELQVELKFAYQKFEFPYRKSLPEFSTKWDADAQHLVRIYRDQENEQEVWKSLSSYGLKRSSTEDNFILRQNITPVDFLISYIPKLALSGYEVYGEEQIKSVRVNRSKPKVSVSVSSGIDWFDVKTVVHFDDMEVPLADIRKAIKKRERYIKLTDGSIAEIPREFIERYKHLFDMSQETEEGMRLSKAQLMILDATVSESEWSVIDEQFMSQREKLRNIRNIEPVGLTDGFNGEFRHYQKSGYDWLHFLHNNNFGGCLADDMGLGKTIQALAFLSSLRKSGHAKNADLVVMPKSLLTNWEREATRFTPDTKILIYADGDRIKDESQFDQFDLILTTYGIMLRDIDILNTYRFHYTVLDESQAIKNPMCQTGKAARLLNADHKLVLTGTPVENSTVELWSQFAYLNPGMLGSLDYFKNEFSGPIERHQDEQTAETLRKMVNPFILRRTKEQVAPELPEKTERVIYCDMDRSQRKLYNQMRDKYRAELLGVAEQSGLQRVRMKILEGLLRLRQIANHPKLIDSTYKGESAKMEVLLEELETIRVEGHKALVFSQFTQMLKIVRSELDTKQIPYLYLDGHTHNRQERVDEFQNNPKISFFLISLKAGGVGLNLTAADYVIHIDPWWNPAVERQASDRTHRIGQDKPVFINRLIAKNSVEEKILELQDRKRDLVDQLITTENSFFKSLNMDEIKELFS